MSAEKIGLLKTIIEGFALAIQARSKRRASIFNNLVLSRFGSLRDIHAEFHSSLYPVEQALGEIERELRTGGNETREKLRTLATTLSDLNAARITGHSNRLELHGSCLVLARGGYRFGGFPDALEQEERDLVASFMNGVCRYFENDNVYQHEYGATVGALVNLVELWAGAEALDAKSVNSTRYLLGVVMARMSKKWTEVVRDFALLEAMLNMNIRPDPPGCGAARRGRSHREPTATPRRVDFGRAGGEAGLLTLTA